VTDIWGTGFEDDRWMGPVQVRVKWLASMFVVLSFVFCYQAVYTERRGQVVNTPSYSDDSEFKSQSLSFQAVHQFQ
jgi:hypothetical protein